MRKLPIRQLGGRKWPAGECMKPESLALLALYQWETYGYNLEIIARSKDDIQVETQLESVEEIDKIMRQAPRRYIEKKEEGK